MYTVIHNKGTPIAFNNMT